MLVGIKDIINVDGFLTRCGSQLPASQLGGVEASSVSKLKAAGAIVASKTVTTEFAVSDPGPTRNPRNLAHTPGGSSSGSAAGVAAGFFDIALGTQTVGSVIRPAAYCGVIGFKPSYGRLRLDGVFGFSSSVDHLGIFANNLDSMDRAMSVLDDQWCENRSIKEIKRRPVIAVPQGSYLDIVSRAALAHFVQLTNTLAGYDFELVHQPIPFDMAEHFRELDLLTYAELYRVHQKLFQSYQHLYQPLTLAGLTVGMAVDDSTLVALRKRTAQRRQQLSALMQEKAIDLWITPAATGPAPNGLASTGDYRMNGVWTEAGLPVITIPSGIDEHWLPFGLQIVGRFGEDELLFEIASLIAQVIGDVKLTNAWQR
jgi:Asp-tRNA(Asn)/Glu-tRNA(Gln) amidotransferase A subunit family amidase